jgi:hypothetical protein
MIVFSKYLINYLLFKKLLFSEEKINVAQDNAINNESQGEKSLKIPHLI